MENAITIGRYLLHRQIARGGMATIHIARLVGDEGFTRIVAAKRMHPEFAEDAEFVQMFLDEARVASKVNHRNIVPVLDVVHTGEEVVLVQEYVHGVPLHWLLRTAHEAKTHVPINVAVSIGCQVLAGLQAAHDTVDEMGTPLDIVHRDVSPQNVMVAIDGTARLLDFGVAKASMAAHVTRDGTFKGKLAYSAPEQIRGQATRQSDVYSLAVVLWELLVGHRMHGSAQAEAELVGEIMSGSLPTITDALAVEREWLGNNRWHQLEELEPIIQRGLSLELAARWESAAEMEAALATAVTPASPTGVAAWLKALGKSFLDGRDRVIAEEEASWRRGAMSSAPRRSPVARAASEPSVGMSVGAATRVDMPAPAPASLRTWRAAMTLGGVIAAVVGAAVIGIVLAVMFSGPRTSDLGPRPERGEPLQREGLEPAAATAAATDTATATGSVTDTATATGSVTDTATITAATVTAKPAASLTLIGAPPPRAPSPPARTRIARSAPKPIAKPVTASSTPAAIVASPPPATLEPAIPPPQTEKPAADKPADNCNPPYYYEGSKKLFKPACL